MDDPLIANHPLSRPKVLVLGNGILRAFGNGARGCQDLEALICKMAGVEPLMDVENLKNEEISLIPFPMRLAASLLKKRGQEKKLETAVEDLIFRQKMGEATANELLCNSGIIAFRPFTDLLEAGFTDVITTNYGYEIEEVLCGKSPTFAKVKNDFYRNCIFPKELGITERKYKIWKHYLSRTTGTRIWHIHGEYLRPHSIIFEYADYCSFLAKVKKPPHLEKDKNSENGTPIRWIDAFVTGDIYILGFGAAFCEQVFWMLMERKKRKGPQYGKVLFYEPELEYFEKDKLIKNQQQQAVLGMMRAFGADPRNMGMTISKDSQFKEFYKLACKDIIAEVKGLKKTGDSSKRSAKRS